MDRRTEEKIKRIGSSIFNQYKHKMFTKVCPMAEKKYEIEERLNRRGPDGVVRKLRPENEAKVRNLLKSDVYNQESLVTNEKAAKEYESHLESVIKKEVCKK